MAFTLAAVALVGWYVGRDDAYVATPGGRGPEALGRASVTSALERLEDAVTDRDVAAVGDLGDEELLEAVVRNADRLEVADFSLRYVDDVAPTEDGALVAVEATWRFEGFDERPASTEVEVRLAADGTEADVVDIGGGSGRTPLWLDGPVGVRRSPGVLVLGDPDADLDAVAARARAAVPVVRDVLEDWSPSLVVEVPSSGGALDRSLGAEQEQYAAIAAVTAAPDGSVAPDAPLHVYVNPDVLGSLRPQGAQVVISHEATHVATRAPLSDLPLWLLEGFADYVALAGVDLPLSTTAGQVVEQVREDGLPTALPGPAEFDTGDAHLGAAYEAAWLATVVLADRVGEGGLVRFYRLAERRGVDDALRAVAGWTEAQLVEAWRQRLSDLAA